MSSLTERISERISDALSYVYKRLYGQNFSFRLVPIPSKRGSYALEVTPEGFSIWRSLDDILYPLRTFPPLTLKALGLHDRKDIVPLSFIEESSLVVPGETFLTVKTGRVGGYVLSDENYTYRLRIASMELHHAFSPPKDESLYSSVRFTLQDDRLQESLFLEPDEGFSRSLDPIRIYRLMLLDDRLALSHFPKISQFFTELIYNLSGTDLLVYSDPLDYGRLTFYFLDSASVELPDHDPVILYAGFKISFLLSE